MTDRPDRPKRDSNRSQAAPTTTTHEIKRPSRKRDLNKIFYNRLFEEVIRTDGLKLKGKSAIEIFSEVERIMISRMKHPDSLEQVIIDHTDSLMKLGKDFHLKGSPWIACVFYATWVEHTVNGLLQTGAVRMKMPRSYLKELYREVGMSAKFTCIFHLFGFKPVSEKHMKQLKRLSDYRNQFIHYKYPPSSSHYDQPSKNELLEFLGEVQKSLRYLKAYKSTVDFLGAKKRIEWLLRDRPIPSHPSVWSLGTIL